MAFRDTTMLWKIAFCIQLIGFILALIGFGINYLATASWGQKSANGGLWKYCYNGDCLDTSDLLTYNKYSVVWLDTSKGMMSISLAAEFATIGLTTLAFLSTPTKLIGLCTAAVSGISVVFGVIGVAVGAGESKRVLNDIGKTQMFDVGASFYLFMVAQGVFLLAAACHGIDSRSRSRQEPNPSVT
ncbi:unnamed protein product [Lymnaea stagnalis]|uniref:Uncharacterized protein n=1 Tax=Lymnaea stagnalis TaxID=6523 RepID=A0AAV2HX22_LYMST